MPANATPERRLVLKLFGAEIVDSPANEGSNGAVRLAQEMAAADPRYTMLFQYENEWNPRAHYEGTGAEIVRDLPRVDALVAGLGTGGTLMGTGARLREAFPDVVVAAAEPLPGDPVMGLRSLEDGYVPPILDVSKLDRKILVSNAESVAAVHALLEREGIFAGVSAGAVVHVARKIAGELPEGSVVVAVLADGGWKYLSGDFWNAEDVERVDGGDALVVVPDADPRGAARARRRGGAERVLRRDRLPRRRRRALRPRPQPPRLAVPLRARDRPRGLVPRGRGLRARRLPLAPRDRAAPLAHRPRAVGPLGRQAVPDLRPRVRRAPRLAHHAATAPIELPLES